MSRWPVLLSSLVVLAAALCLGGCTAPPNDSDNQPQTDNQSRTTAAASIGADSTPDSVAAIADSLEQNRWL